MKKSLIIENQKTEKIVKHIDRIKEPSNKRQDILMISFMTLGVVIENISFSGFVVPNPAGMLLGVLLLSVATYKLCEQIEYSYSKRLAICIVNMALPINMYLSIGLLIEYGRKKNLIDISWSTMLSRL